MAVADKILVLEHGTVKQFGPRTDVIASFTPESRLPNGAKTQGTIRLLRSSKANDE
jgi:ABC-type protease/lipase transport system fused ATPase/permease subunit